MFERILVANRGEIALRVVRSCRVLGIETVAVYTDVDAGAPHTGAADRAVPLRSSDGLDGYLSISQLLDAARASGAQAIHPGYGFLSENAEFAAACADADIAFVGPSADVIARTGSKIACRGLAEAAGVPVIPGGVPDDQSLAGVRAAIATTGFPALLKPSAGGGGKGMQIVTDEASVDTAVATARREGVRAFGDGTLYVERFLTRPRHIEVQVVGDRRRDVVHLHERDCSVQRRYQKVVEETPAPNLAPTVRDRITADAVAIARQAGYDNVGTVEFLVDDTGRETRHYFLEMNTRLQVEHPVTEMCTGVDLVQAQIEIAAGQPLPWQQTDISSRGHAIECRVYAEDPAHDYLPQAGPLRRYREPTGPGLRVDAGVAEGGEVTVHYDPLLAKLAAHAPTREGARRRAADALRRYIVLGLRTNLTFLLRVLDHPRFVAGGVPTTFLAEEHVSLTEPDRSSPHLGLTAALAAAAAVAAAGGDDGAVGPPADPWVSLHGWR